MDTVLFSLPLNLSLIGRIDAGWASTVAGSLGGEPCLIAGSIAPQRVPHSGRIVMIEPSRGNGF